MRFLTAILLFAILLPSCMEENTDGNMSLQIKSVNSNFLKIQNRGTQAEIVITDFRLSIRDVEFKKDESDLGSNEVEFRGPYDIDLMNPSDALSQTIGTLTIPEGTYKVIRFKLHKSRDRAPSHVLYDRSLFMAGTIDNVPFEFWHDASENFDIENIGGIVVMDNFVNIVVQFDMDQFMDSYFDIDLSAAQDENDNGLIEINPDVDDENGEIADQIKRNIKEAADLIKLD